MFNKIERKGLFLSVLIFISLALLLQSCSLGGPGYKPSTGRSNEILIVTNSDALWKGEIGDTIKTSFGQELEGLPQAEDSFEMIHIQAPDFSQLYQSHHNIFILDINESIEKPIVETKIDFWAKPQRIIKITAPDKSSFFKAFSENKESFISLFNETERERTSNAFASVEDEKIKNQLINSYNISMLFPKTFYIATTTSNFVWLRREAEKYSQGVFIYFYPYTDTMAFNPQRIIELRDSVTKKYIPGPSEGSYMKSAVIIPPISKKINFNDNFAIETRGLWELEGDFMGGPFINYTFVDSVYNRVITIDGYVYFPSQDKKNLLRQLEAIIYSFQIPGVGVVGKNEN